MPSAFSSFAAEIKKQIGKLNKLVSGQGKTVKSLLIFIITTLLNQLATKEYFKCPGEKKHEQSGWAFMFVPGILLAFIILMASDRVSQGSILCGKKKRAQLKFFCRTISLSLTYSVLAFLSWVVATLLFTETFACIKLGPAPNTKNETKIEIYKSKKDGKNAESKVLGLYILLVAFIVQVILFFIHKCCLSDLTQIEDRLKSMDSYDKLEAETAKAEFESMVDKHGKLNGKKVVDDFTNEGNPPSGEDEENENTKDKPVLFSRQQIKDWRKRLIEMYPRLENPLDRRLPYKKVEGKSMALGDGEEEALL